MYKTFLLGHVLQSCVGNDADMTLSSKKGFQFAFYTSQSALMMLCIRRRKGRIFVVLRVEDYTIRHASVEVRT